MITIVIPTYNRANLLHECVKPLMGLNVGLLEVVFVDDASTDNTQEVVRSLIAEYGSLRVRYFKMETNSGAQAARNRGISEARGDFVMFIDSDDVSVGSGVLELVQKLERCEGLDYAYGRVVPTDEKLQPLVGRDVWGSSYDGSNAGLAGYHWHTMGAVYRRCCLEKVGPWDEDLTGSQDWEFQARVKVYGGKGCFVPVVVGLWREHKAARVGTKEFRLDYVRSVMKACALIIHHANKAGKCDRALERKISKRLIVHAIAYGGAGYLQEKKACLAQAAETAPCDVLLQLLIKLLRWSPQPMDLLADKVARWIQGRP